MHPPLKRKKRSSPYIWTLLPTHQHTHGVLIHLPKGEPFDRILVNADPNSGGLTAWKMTKKEDRKTRDQTAVDKVAVPNQSKGPQRPQMPPPAVSKFYEHYQQRVIVVPLGLIELLVKNGITNNPYGHAAMLVYIHDRWQSDSYRSRGIPTWHSDWQKALLLSERWAKDAQRRLVKAGFLRVVFSLDLGKRCNRYILNHELAEILSPGALILIEEAEGTQTYEAEEEDPFGKTTATRRKPSVQKKER